MLMNSVVQVSQSEAEKQLQDEQTMHLQGQGLWLEEQLGNN